MREVAAIAVIKFFLMVISLLESPSLLVQEGETSLMVKQMVSQLSVVQSLSRRDLFIKMWET